MGLYDDVSLFGGPLAQVKCWGSSMAQLSEGSEVGPLDGCEDYAVALREGGFAVVAGGVLQKWIPVEPEDWPVFDKWGERWQPDTADDYLFEEVPSTE